MSPLEDLYKQKLSYYGVDYDIVGDVAVNKIPTLDTEIRLILKGEYPE